MSFVKPIMIDGDNDGEIRLFKGDDVPRFERTAFTSRMAAPVTREDYEQLLVWLKGEDWRSLHEWNRELLPWYCPECDRLFSGNAWRTWDSFDDDDGWHDSVRGTCPNGHERMLED